MIRDPRRVYVSWLEPSDKSLQDPDRIRWTKELIFTLDASGCRPVDTGKGPPPGDKRESWLASQLGQITDVVGVLTRAYVIENRDVDDKPSAGELARFFAYALGDKKDCLRVYLAPLERPIWETRVYHKELGDRTLRWLDRLREDRFPWPNDPGWAGGKFLEPIEDAVGVILDKPVKGGGTTHGER